MRPLLKLLTLLLVPAALLSLWATAQEKPTAEESAAKREAGFAKARSNALTLSHQIAASGGYRSRDTQWVGTLDPSGFAIVPLHLYAGNRYYVLVGTDGKEDQLAAAVFDPQRMLVKASPDSGDGKMAIEVVPKETGPHYLRLHQRGDGEREGLLHVAVGYVFK